MARRVERSARPPRPLIVARDERAARGGLSLADAANAAAEAQRWLVRVQRSYRLLRLMKVAR